MRFYPAVFILFIFSGIFLCPSSVWAQKNQSEQHIEVSLRMIGHQILLQAGDSISRVLPIKKENNQYRIQFESDFEFNPDLLVNTVNQVMKDSELTNGYYVEVEQCETDEVVYSYEMGDLKEMDIIPCVARDLPKSCYSLVFTLKIDVTSTDSIVDSNSKITSLKYSLLSVFGVLLAGMLFLLWRRKQQSLIDPNMISLGKFRFDKKNSALVMEQQRIELSSKESDLLLLLYNDVDQTIEREIILSKVWGDEGDYVGRTLDVFISKLRKKLEADPNVKIVNIRGIGYKLVLN